jgi:hypothetical protein
MRRIRFCGVIVALVTVLVTTFALVDSGASAAASAAQPTAIRAIRSDAVVPQDNIKCSDNVHIRGDLVAAICANELAHGLFRVGVAIVNAGQHPQRVGAEAWLRKKYLGGCRRDVHPGQREVLCLYRLETADYPVYAWTRVVGPFGSGYIVTPTFEG